MLKLVKSFCGLKVHPPTDKKALLPDSFGFLSFEQGATSHITFKPFIERSLNHKLYAGSVLLPYILTHSVTFHCQQFNAQHLFFLSALKSVVLAAY